MSGHLSSQRISLWMLGERDARDERHVGECAQCAAEVARFEAALGQFRGSLRVWSSRQEHRKAAAHWAAPAGFWNWGGRLAAVAAVLLLAILVPQYKGPRQPKAATVIAQADVQWLNDVDSGVSRAAPQAMEPLLKLVAWDTSAAANATEKDNNDTQQ